MSDQRSSGPVMVVPPRVSDAVGAALRNAFRDLDGPVNEWDAYLRRIDCADRLGRS